MDASVNILHYLPYMNSEQDGMLGSVIELNKHPPK